MAKLTKNIVLVGPMGSGKTSVGRRLACVLKRAFDCSSKGLALDLAVRLTNCSILDDKYTTKHSFLWVSSNTSAFDLYRNRNRNKFINQIRAPGGGTYFQG
jgi:cytidylate kinase